MGLAELILTIVVYLGGAITEYETKGAVTHNIYYSDSNISECR